MSKALVCVASLKENNMIHTKQEFQRIVYALNQIYKGWIRFQLVGSLVNRPASFHDADIVVYPRFRFDLETFAKGCVNGGLRVEEIDRTSEEPFPGRPQGQDRVRVRWPEGKVIDFFFPKVRPLPQEELS